MFWKRLTVIVSGVMAVLAIHSIVFGVGVFSLGAVIFLTWAAIVFLSLRFNEFYWADQASSPGAPDIVMEGNTELSVLKEVISHPMPAAEASTN